MWSFLQQPWVSCIICELLWLTFKSSNGSHMGADERLQVKVCMRVFTTLMSWTNKNKSCIKVDESWEARVCMSHWSWWEITSESLYQWEFSHKSCMIVDKSWEARICMRVFSTLMSWSNEDKSCMRVDESWEARVCMRVWTREFVRKFSQLSSLLKRKQELH